MKRVKSRKRKDKFLKWPAIFAFYILAQTRIINFYFKDNLQIEDTEHL